MTILGQEKPDLTDLAHHGVKGMHWGVRTTDGGSISSGTQRHMDKAETKFQAKRAAANARVASDKKNGVTNAKNITEAAKLNAQHKVNQQALHKTGLETYKKMPDSVKKAKASHLPNRRYSSTGEKVAVGLLTGPVGLVGLHFYNTHH